MASNSPKPLYETLLEGLNLTEFKKDLKEIKKEAQESIKNDTDYAGEGDLLIILIENLEKELEGVKTTQSLDKNHQVRILAHLTFLHRILEDAQDEDEDEDFDDEEDDEDFDDEDDLDFAEEEDDEEEKIEEKGKGRK